MITRPSDTEFYFLAWCRHQSRLLLVSGRIFDPHVNADESDRMWRTARDRPLAAPQSGASRRRRTLPASPTPADATARMVIPDQWSTVRTAGRRLPQNDIFPEPGERQQASLDGCVRSQTVIIITPLTCCCFGLPFPRVSHFPTVADVPIYAYCMSFFARRYSPLNSVAIDAATAMHSKHAANSKHTHVRFAPATIIVVANNWQ